VAKGALPRTPLLLWTGVLLLWGVLVSVVAGESAPFGYYDLCVGLGPLGPGHGLASHPTRGEAAQLLLDTPLDVPRPRSTADGTAAEPN
jgi:hypothetical protein